ncbi:MAG: hypothetical protein KDB02_00730 [Acidimicrobiales bacterium]|nr:hypothetical protein [Acidimicrobiales bacterium]
MFESLAPLVIAVPAALFGRRRNETHGEVSFGGASAATGTDGVDAFSAFADLFPSGQEDNGSAPTEPDGELGGELPSTLPAEPEEEIADGTYAGAMPLSGVVDGVGRAAPEPVPQSDRPNELWHSFGGHDTSTAPQLAPFEETVGFAADGPGEWSTLEVAGTRHDSARPGTQFRLNRLRPVVVGPEPVMAHSGQAGDEPRDDPPPSLSAGLLTGRPVGRSRVRPFVAGRATDFPGSGYSPRGSHVAPMSKAGSAGEASREPENDETEPQSVAPERPTTVQVLIAADGDVATGFGSVRVAGPEAASVTSGPDGLVVHLSEHWCWAALDEFSNGIVVRAGTTALTLSGGSTGLLSIDEDGAHLVVVLAGEGVVEREDETIQLGSGAMAYLPREGEPQVDVASDDEIKSDPLVARNLWLDAN